ncbi:RNA polymerase subunit sigma-24 [bacterium 336/3]|nr:RNA polymerase subunit sigma-24 [bacterium 336/3]
MKTVMNLSMAQKNSISITETVKKYSKKLFGFIRGKVKSSEDAEDILQDIWYQLSNIDPDNLENVNAWLHRVARNKVTDSYRKKTNELLEDYAYENEEGELNFKEILLLDDSNNPDLEFFKETFWRELMEALEELPEKQRQVFMMNEIEDLTLQEIADQTGENLKTIISRKQYAIKHLRNKLGYLYEELNY